MIRKIIYLLAILLPFLTISQDEMEEEILPDIPIGSAGIDLAPEEEIVVPTPPASTVPVESEQTAQPEITQPEPSPPPSEEAGQEAPQDSSPPSDFTSEGSE